MMASPPNVTAIMGEEMATDMADEASQQLDRYYSPLFRANLAMPQWEALLTVTVLSALIATTVVGNVLVIVSVFTHAPLKITSNYFIVSLAAADLTVSILVLPLNVLYQVLQ